MPVRHLSMLFTVTADRHDDIIRVATDRWREFLHDSEADLPFATEISVTANPAHETNADAGRWLATVMIKYQSHRG